MRIGQFTDSFLPIVDGVGRVVLNYALTLSDKGHECYVIAPMSKVGYLGNTPYELLEFLSVEVPTQKQYYTGIPPLDAHYRERIQRISLDIVHAHSPFIAGREAIFIARKKKIPMVGTFHSRYYDDFYKLTKMDVAANLAHFDEVIETPAGCTISSHCGPNTLGILFLRTGNKRENS